MALVTWTPVECYSMTSKFANYHWTEGFFYLARQSGDPVKGSLFCVAISVAAVAETILNSVVLVLDTAKGIYTFPKKVVVSVHNAYVEKNEVEREVKRCRIFERFYMVASVSVVFIACFDYLRYNRKMSG